MIVMFYSNNRPVRVLIAVAALLSLPARPTDAAADRRPVPAVSAACDVTDWRAARLGRDRLPAEAGADVAGGLLVLTGGAFASADLDPKDRDAAVIGLADAAGFDVINLAQRDLAGDLRPLSAAVAGARAAVVSASFTLPEGTPTPWKSHVVLDRGGRRVAVIGVAVRSGDGGTAGVAPAKGLAYLEPADALRKAIGEAGEVDALIVIADAPVSEAASWRKAFPDIDTVVVSGRGGGGAAVAGLPGVLRAPPGGRALGVLPADGAKPAFGLNLPSPADVSDAYAQVAGRFTLEPERPQLADPATAADAAAEPAPARAVPTALEGGRLTPLGLSAANRAAVVTVESAGLVASFGGQAAPAGRQYLVLDLSFRNILSPQTVRDRLVPVTYLIPKLSDHLYLVADGGRVLQPVAMPGAAGILSTGELRLERAGSTGGGKLVYETDAGRAPRELTLRLYDYAHGSLVLPVLARPADAPATPEPPVAPPVKNEVVELAAYDLKKATELGGRKAPPGMTFVSLDLRARSQFTFTADATAFDPKARTGAKTQVGTVADWTDSRKYLQLVADGVYGYVPQPQTALAASPRFLPDVMTGDRVVFLAPAGATSLELRCDFPNARTPGGKVLRPRGFTLALEGKRPPAVNRKSIAKVEDDVFVVTVTNQSAGATFGGRKAEAGRRFVVLDVTVNNRGRDGEFFQTAEQLKIADAAGAQADPDAATYAGVYRPAEHVWIPAGERRSFQVAYQIPAAETRPRLAYAGVSKAEVVELARLAPPAAAAAAAQASAPTAEMPEGEPAGSPRAGAGGDSEGPPPAVARGDSAPTAEPGKPQGPDVLEADGKKYPARVPVRPDLKPKGLAGVGLRPEQVNAAIDKGAAFLWNFIKAEDLGRRRAPFGGDREHVLAALALVHSGGHKRFPEFDAQLRKYLGSFKANECADTYQVGIYCMLVGAYGDPTFLPQLRHAARWLVETQGPQGAWAYGRRIDPGLFKDPDAQKALRVSGGRPLDGSDVAEPLTRRVTDWKTGADGDNSVSQYALLGLHAASRSRVKPAAELWRRSLAVHQERQNADDGGWAYSEGSRAYGSMTCAGVCALALARHELGDNDPAIEERIERGLAWLNAHFAVDHHPEGSDGWVYYYLYSLERVGRILDTEFVGDHEWYPLGARHLVDKQEADGRWVGGGEEEDPRLAGSFALLFLTRATESLAEPKRSGPGTLKTAVSLPPGRKLYVILDASGSMLAEMDGRPKFDIARDALAALIKELPPNAEVALRVYGHRKRALDAGASEDSEQLAPMAPLKKDALLQTIARLRARGKTPLAYSLERALGDLPAATAESPLTVLLLTDGGEDTQPRRDPVAAAAAYAKLPNVRLRVVGFDIGRADWSTQLQAMAAAARGQYLPAAQGGALLRELRAAVFETPERFTVLAAAGDKQVAAGRFGEAVELPAGKYRIRAAYAGRTFEETFWVNAGTATAVTFDATHASPTGAAATTDTAATAPAPPRGAAHPKAKFCTECGKPRKPAAKFCTSCGAPAKP